MSIWREDLEAMQKHDASFSQPPSVSCQSDPHKPKLTSYPSAKIFSIAPKYLTLKHGLQGCTCQPLQTHHPSRTTLIPLKTVGYLCPIAILTSLSGMPILSLLFFLGGWWEQLGFPGGTSGKETWVQSLCWEDSLEEDTATYFSFLVWRIWWTEELGNLWSTGSQRVGLKWLSTHSCTHKDSWQIIYLPSKTQLNLYQEDFPTSKPTHPVKLIISL